MKKLILVVLVVLAMVISGNEVIIARATGRVTGINIKVESTELTSAPWAFWEFGRENVDVILFKDALPFETLKMNSDRLIKLHPPKIYGYMEYKSNTLEKISFGLGYFALPAYGLIKGGDARYWTFGVSFASGGIINSLLGSFTRTIYRIFSPPKCRYIAEYMNTRPIRSYPKDIW